MKKIVRLTEADLTRIVNKVLSEDIEFDVEHPDFGEPIGDYRADIYGTGEYSKPDDFRDIDFDEEDWDEPEEFESYEDFKRSQYYSDPENRWSASLRDERGRKYFDQERMARKKHTGSDALRVRRPRRRD